MAGVPPAALAHPPFHRHGVRVQRVLAAAEPRRRYHREPVPCPDGMSVLELPVATSSDWKISMVGWMYALFFVFLGSSAAVFGRWLEHVGPRKAGVVAAARG